MLVSEKCRYALKAVFELARRYGEGPVRISEIAAAQGIPARFLEVILGQMKQGGFVQSRRGAQGGYYLLKSPRLLTVGDVVRLVEGPVEPVRMRNRAERWAPDDIFDPLWRQLREKINEVYDGVTFGSLVEEERKRRATYVLSYVI